MDDGALPGLPGGIGPRLPAALACGPGPQAMAQALGLAMARRAADILARHRDILKPGPAGPGGADERQLALDDAVFSAVLDAVSDCLGPADSRPPDGRWCDALLHLLELASHAPCAPGG